MSKFWDLLAEKHKEELKEYGFGNFRRFIAPSYSASGIYDTHQWIQSSYKKCLAQGIDFYYEDSLIGAPLYINIEGKNVTQDLIHSCWEVNSLQQIDWSQIKTVCEIGGGNGRTAEAIKRKYPHVEYTIVDIEPAVSITQVFLSHLDIRVKFSNKIPANQDLYIAISVFSELTKPEVQEYMDTIKTGKYFYLKDWGHHNNKHNETEVNEAHYCIPDFECLFKRDYPWYPGFFEALYKI